MWISRRESRRYICFGMAYSLTECECVEGESIFSLVFITATSRSLLSHRFFRQVRHNTLVLYPNKDDRCKERPLLKEAHVCVCAEVLASGFIATSIRIVFRNLKQDRCLNICFLMFEEKDGSRQSRNVTRSVEATRQILLRSTQLYRPIRVSRECGYSSVDLSSLESVIVQACNQ